MEHIGVSIDRAALETAADPADTYDAALEDVLGNGKHGKLVDAAPFHRHVGDSHLKVDGDKGKVEATLSRLGGGGILDAGKAVGLEMAEGRVEVELSHEGGRVRGGHGEDAVDLLDGCGGVGLGAAHVRPGGVWLGW